MICPFELESPSFAHLFGTTIFCRDVFDRCLYGTRIVLTIGIIPILLSIPLGVFYR